MRSAGQVKPAASQPKELEKKEVQQEPVKAKKKEEAQAKQQTTSAGGTRFDAHEAEHRKVAQGAVAKHPPVRPGPFRQLQPQKPDLSQLPELRGAPKGEPFKREFPVPGTGRVKFEADHFYSRGAQKPVSMDSALRANGYRLLQTPDGTYALNPKQFKAFLEQVPDRMVRAHLQRTLQ